MSSEASRESELDFHLHDRLSRQDRGLRRRPEFVVTKCCRVITRRLVKWIATQFTTKYCRRAIKRRLVKRIRPRAGRKLSTSDYEPRFLCRRVITSRDVSSSGPRLDHSAVHGSKAAGGRRPQGCSAATTQCITMKELSMSDHEPRCLVERTTFGPLRGPWQQSCWRPEVGTQRVPATWALPKR